MSNGLGLRHDLAGAANVVSAGAAVAAELLPAELLPADLRESYVAARRKPGGALVRARRWLVVATAYALEL